VLQVANSPEFRDKSPKQIVPLLADQGDYLASESTFYRVLHQAKQMAPRGRAKPAERRKPAEHVATGPNQVWSWDITYLRSKVRGRFFYLYLFVDVWSRKIVAQKVFEEESSDLAAALLNQALLKENITGVDLIVHSDNGSPMKGATLKATMERLGVIPSFSRPRVSDDNPYSEALFRTMKYRPEYPRKAFDSVEEAQDWVDAFDSWYNKEHLHSAIGFVTPLSRHEGQDIDILERRRHVYEAARQRNPERWNGRASRRWDSPQESWLNRAKAKRVLLETIGSN